MRAKGSVTIFLSLALILVIALVGSLLESARVTVAREIATDDSYLAVQNILAEYQREVWDDYHVFFVDASEVNGEGGAIKLGNSYLNKMLHSENNDYMGARADFTEIGFKENMTENNCYYFVKQAAAYMKYRTATSMGEKLIGKKDILKTAEIDAMKKALKIKVEAEKKIIEIEREKKKLEEKAEKVKDNLNKVKGLSDGEVVGVNEGSDKEKINVKPIKKSEAKKKYKEYQKNLDIATNEGAAGGLLGMFLSSGKRVSKLHIDNTVWNEIETMEKENKTLADDGLLIMYAKEHFKNFLSKSEENDKREALKYGIEYLISGKNSDEGNLSSVANRIFGIRTLVWYSYLLTRQDKVAEAEAIAIAIAGALALPAAVEIIKLGIIMGWAIDEARQEVRTLLNGGEIPMFPGNTGGMKLKYESFLDSFIVLAVNTLPVRTVKLIEQNIKVRYYNGFRADNLYAGITGEVRIQVEPRIFRLAMLDGIVQKNFSNWESRIQVSQSLCRE
ncbi:MAG: DUF5702 domain-containing protein [Catonella sp.]|uniref:DUF5702 domain-containing protein n=1 Tax=Catonella sp. TaxID=2382125 RepID=UPI003F9FC933